MGHTNKAVTAPIRSKQSNAMSSSTARRVERAGDPGYQEWKASAAVRSTVEAFARAAVEASRSTPRGARPWWVADLESQVLRALATDRPVNLQVVSVLIAKAAELGGDVEGALERCAAKLAVVLDLGAPDDQECHSLLDLLLMEQDSARAEDAIQDRLHTRDFSPSTLMAYRDAALANVAHKQTVVKVIDRTLFRQ